MDETGTDEAEVNQLLRDKLALVHRTTADDDDGAEVPEGGEEDDDNGYPAAVVQLRPVPEDEERNTARYNGLEFADRVRGLAVWTKQADWLVWNGQRWEPDELLVHRRLMDDLTDHLRSRLARAHGEERDLLNSRVRSLERTDGRNGALSFAQPYLSRSLRAFDTDPWLLNCPNGTLDLRTFDLRPQDPADLITRVLPVAYDPAARNETWEAFIAAMLPDPEMRGTFQRFIGSCLTGVNQDKRFLVPTGPTNTGKSTAVEPFLKLLGDVDAGGYATVWDAQVVQRNSSVNRAEKTHKARAARLIVIGELEKGSRFDDGFVKRLTGGDTVDAKQLFKDSYSFQPQAKLLMHTNYVPKSADPAVHGRLTPLPFTQQVAQPDPALKHFLETDPGCQRALLAWAVEGCRQWQDHGLGGLPWVPDLMLQYVLDSDPVAAYISECYSVTGTSEGSTHVDAVWQVYQQWSRSQLDRPMRRRAFERALEERGHVRRRIPAQSGPTYWFGLQLNDSGQRLLTEATAGLFRPT